MDSDRHREDRIIASWVGNAAAWRMAVHESRIESRRRVTDRAIVEVVLEESPASLLDLGCGEGWLCRALSAHGIETVGVDGIAELIGSARDSASGDYRTLTYDQIAAGDLRLCVDTVVSNFSLLGKQSVERVFQAVPALLGPRGRFIVQTLHPLEACPDMPYSDGWRSGSWNGCGGGFSDPAPWYFRTLDSWIELFTSNGFRLREIREPCYPQQANPVSIIFVSSLRD
ncbi:MAG: class I SAM-dependent methyltransferase [Sedimenticola sp.]|nr:class I SAM-dependent methyltransferase [Sedimenticola sp.]